MEECLNEFAKGCRHRGCSGTILLRSKWMEGVWLHTLRVSWKIPRSYDKRTWKYSRNSSPRLHRVVWSTAAGSFTTNNPALPVGTAGSDTMHRDSAFRSEVFGGCSPHGSRSFPLRRVNGGGQRVRWLWRSVGRAIADKLTAGSSPKGAIISSISSRVPWTAHLVLVRARSRRSGYASGVGSWIFWCQRLSNSRFSLYMWTSLIRFRCEFGTVFDLHLLAAPRSNFLSRPRLVGNTAYGVMNLAGGHAPWAAIVTVGGVTLIF